MKERTKRFMQDPIFEEPSEEVSESVENVIEEPVFEEKTGVVIACTSLYVRSAAHANAAPNDVISEGNTVKVIGEEGEFWKIESPEGYCKKQFIKIL